MLLRALTGVSLKLTRRTRLRRDFVSRLDKAAKVGVIPANRAARKKSQADKLVVAK